MSLFKRTQLLIASLVGITLVLDAAILERQQSPTSTLRFEVASIRPLSMASFMATTPEGCHGVDDNRPSVPRGRCIFRNRNLRQLIGQAYGFKPALPLYEQVVGGPGWVDGTTFDIEAKAEDTSSTTTDQLRQMLRTLLQERFKLAFHTETKVFSGYHMVPAKDGFKLKEATGPLTSADYVAATRNFTVRPFFANNMTLGYFADLLSTVLVKSPVLDKTGIRGKYNIFLSAAETGDETAGSIFTALQEQVGLRLEAQKIPFEIIVIDQAEKPAEIGGR